MTSDDARFIANVQLQLRWLSIERLFWLAEALAEQLDARGLDCAPEARALVAALLADAHAQRRAIFSTDCLDTPAAYYSRRSPDRPAPAES
jgi:hypothetical protein